MLLLLPFYTIHNRWRYRRPVIFVTLEVMQLHRHHVKRVYNHSFTRYILIGGSTFVIDFGVLIFGHTVLHLSPVVAATVSYWLSLAYNFTLNKLWTFGVRHNTHRHAILYGCLVGINYLTTIGLIWLLGRAGIHYLVAKVCAVALTMVWNYIAYKKVIFVEPDSA